MSFLLDILLTAVIFIAVIGILVFVHELGHFLAAKRMGVIVQEFALGFGPTLLHKTWGDTDYIIKLLPLGGYCKMLGDQDGSSFMRYEAKAYNPEDKTFALEVLSKHKLDPQKSSFTKIYNFFEAQSKSLNKADYQKLQNYIIKDYIPNHPGNYDNKKIWQRAVIISAGVFMNFVFGCLLFYIFLSLNYYITDVRKVGNPIIVGAETSNPPYLFQLYGKDSDKFGVIETVNGKPVTSQAQMQQILADNYNKPLELGIMGDKGLEKISEVLDGDGYRSNFDSDLTNAVYLYAIDPASAAATAGLQNGDVLLSISDVPLNSTDVLRDILKSQRGLKVNASYLDTNGDKHDIFIDLPDAKDGDPILGAVPLQNSSYLDSVIRINYNNNILFSGIAHAINISVYNFTGLGELISQSVKEKSIAPVSTGVSSIVGVSDVFYSLVKVNDFLNILNLSAMLSVTLAAMNILPIPLFDGGHLFLLVIEKIRGRKLSETTQERIGTISFFVLIILTVLIMFKDVIQFNWIGRILSVLTSIFPH